MDFMWDNLFRTKSNSDPILNTLKGNFLFSELSRKELILLKEFIYIRSYKAGEIIFRQDEVGFGMYAIVSGSVDITVEDHGLHDTKNSIYVTRLEEGDFFGEIALIEDHGRRTANATACDETQVIGFFQSGLNDIIDRSPGTGVKILKNLSEVLGKRLRETSDKITDLKNEMSKG